MEKRKPGRPKSDKPIRDRMLSMRISDEEYNLVQKVCYENKINYIDILLKGLESWSRN